MLLVDSLFEQGNIYKQNKRYVDVILSYEDALNTRISDYKLNNELGFTILEFLKKDLTLCYNDRTKEIWYNHDISKMEEAVNYMNKGKT